MSLAKLFRTLREKRRLDKALRTRKAIRQIRREAAIKGEMTKYANRVARHRQTWGELV